MRLGVDKDERELLPGVSVHFMVKDPPIERLCQLIAYLLPFVNEVVIVDTGSHPVTLAKMKDWRYGGEEKQIRVIEREFVDFSTTRNEGLAEHRYEWTLGLDPDELPSWAMMAHIRYVTSPEGMQVHEYAKGWCYWTYNWWDGVLGAEMPYHYHTRLWKTKDSYLYRPVHELVKVCGKDEIDIRGSSELPFAPKECHLLHSKGQEHIEKADALYTTLGEVSH